MKSVKLEEETTRLLNLYKSVIMKNNPYQRKFTDDLTIRKALTKALKVENEKKN